MNDSIVDVGFMMCLLGMIIIICCGLLLPKYSKKNLYNKIILIGSVIAALGGLIILVRIV